ncbi:DUF29 domain-containing protein [Okeania sp. KiyG1]|uniref:DUF29 domain-containing protein n=1 Tax=Okeania sp. KiyG1 TaxID=2720165 RepID=UPI001924DAAC|nr:DUF29 domain-containing protein [Okeania sp. KiyG1]GGA02660.1 hypothetical protein CYANOKiyG1_14680 [Okeania sp. KiyG1]
MVNHITDLKLLYEEDYFLWLEETIELLNNRQLENLDYENLIEELEALGRSEKSAVESFVILIIQHLLLYQYWSEERANNSRHWRGEILTFRTQLEFKLTTNIPPLVRGVRGDCSSLRNNLAERLDYLYGKARKIAQVKSELQLPEINPYSLEKILDEDWLPE